MPQSHDVGSIVDRAVAASGLGTSVTFIDGDDHDTITWAELLDEARGVAAALQARGIGPGSHVGLLGPTSRALVATIEAVWLTGATLVVLPLPMRMGSLDGFIAQTRARIAAAEIDLVVIDPQLSEFVVPTPDDPPFAGYADLEGVDPTAFEPADIDPDSLALLQFTSGSTSEPKGVMLTHRQVLANIDGCVERSQVTPADTVVSWLPLYHDMGLIGLFSIPMCTGMSLVLGAPQDFLVKPRRWMEWVSRYGGTIIAGPNFSFVLASRTLRRAEGLDLSSLRICLSGAEPIDADAFRSFLDAGAPFGMRPEVAFPAFGMAEVCIGGTFPDPLTGLRTDWVDGPTLEHDATATPVAPGTRGARELAMLGRAIPGLELRIVDQHTGEPCADREVGELLIRGSSVTSGYFRQPEATAELIVDGWLRTGDLAYLVDGDLVICGRIKDVIIIGGRNIHPQDIERVVGSLDDVRAGNVVAFGDEEVAARQHIVIAAETRSERVEELTAAISRAVADEIGVPPNDVVLLPPGTVPKTSSGKLQRSACRELYRSGQLVP